MFFFYAIRDFKRKFFFVINWSYISLKKYIKMAKKNG